MDDIEIREKTSRIIDGIMEKMDWFDASKDKINVEAICRTLSVGYYFDFIEFCNASFDAVRRELET